MLPPPGGMWRVARLHQPLKPSVINVRDADLPRAGNRFDVPGVGVLYLATEREGCFAETLARFRPTPARAVLEAASTDAGEQGLMTPGAVPREWREERTQVRVTCPDDMYFVDVDDPATHTRLLVDLETELRDLGIEDIDVSTIRGPDRRLTRLVASWAYYPDPDLREGYAGLRYRSRLGAWECWALFADVPVEQVEQRPIESNDQAMVTVADLFGLRVF